jgi:WD40 repeat protein
MSEPALDPTTLATLLARSAQRWSEMDQVAPRNTEAATLALSSKLYNEYKRPHQAPSLAAAAASKLAKTSTELVVPQAPSAGLPSSQTLSRALMVRRQQPEAVPAKPHNQWKLMRVIAGHVGVPMCVGVDPSNKIFATGAADRTIKIWDLATGGLKMTLTGQHTHTVRSVAFSSRHAFMFSAGEGACRLLCSAAAGGCRRGTGAR